MVVALYDAGGVLVAYMDATPEIIDLNVPPGGRFEESTPAAMNAEHFPPEQDAAP